MHILFFRLYSTENVLNSEEQGTNTHYLLACKKKLRYTYLEEILMTKTNHFESMISAIFQFEGNVINKPRQVGLVVSVSTSHEVGLRFMPWPSHHHESGTNCLPAWHACVSVGV